MLELIVEYLNSTFKFDTTDSQWTTYMTVSVPIMLKMFGRLFWFATDIGSYSFCRIFDGMSCKRKFNILLFSQVEIYAKQKSSKHFSIWWEVTLSCRLFIVSIRKTIKTSKIEFYHTDFVEIFAAHLFKKNSRCYHSHKPRYLRNKKG